MSVTARLMPVVAMLLAALVDGSLNTRPVLAEDNCLTAPNARAPQGSHWYYRTDPVKQSKCWHLRTEGPAAQKPAAQETTETKFSVEGLAATPSKSVSDQLGPSSLELRPAQAAQAADKPTKMNIPNNTQPNRQAADARAWPNPPVPAAAKVAWPDPPAPTAANNVAWPDPPAPTAANNVAWPEPPSPGALSPVRGGAQEVTAENAPATTGTPEEDIKQPQEVPTHSIKRTGDDAELNGYIAEPKTPLVTQKAMPMSMLLAFGIGLAIAGLVMRLVVRAVFGRRPTVELKRREAVLSTSIASQRTLPTFGDLAPESDAAVHLDNNVKESLRKLLKVLEQQTA